MIVGAPPKHFKSFLTMELAYALASGTKFLEWEVDKPQKVLYAEQEIGPWGTKSRMEKLHSQKADLLAGENLFVATKGKKRYSLDEGSVGLANLRAEIEAVQPEVLIIDPLRKFTHAQEDSSTEMVKVFQSLDQLQEDFGLTTIIVHHAGKRSEFRDNSSPESLRGSSEIFADGDSYMIMEQPVKGRQDVLRLHFTFRHAAPIAPVVVHFDKETGTFKIPEKG